MHPKHSSSLKTVFATSVIHACHPKIHNITSTIG